MKVVNYIGLFAIGFSISVTGCKKTENPLDKEQYQKNVYLVGANQSNNEGVQIVNLPYKASAEDTAATFISIATGGSKPIEQDLTVQLREAGGDALQRYNGMYLYKATDIKYRLLNPTFYSVPNFSAQIKSGEIYGRVPLQIKTASLHPDSLYAMTFSIASVSDPERVSIRKTDTVLIFSFRLYNDYSGTYQESGRYYKLNNATPQDTVSLSLARTLKAVNHNTMRFYHLATTENVSNVAASGVSVTVNSDHSLTVSPWGTLEITAGGGTYDPSTKLFTIWYNYIQSGVTYQFKGTFTKSSS
jgi:hypothetical protein